jgi:riboflavin biosynthesis pyrimidine reductase
MKMEQHESWTATSGKSESLTNEKDHLKFKLKKLKKKVQQIKAKAGTVVYDNTSATEAAAVQQQQQNQVMYVPIIAGLLTNGEQNVVTTTVTAASLDTQQGSVSAITSCPVPTNALLLWYHWLL